MGTRPSLAQCRTEDHRGLRPHRQPSDECRHLRRNRKLRRRRSCTAASVGSRFLPKREQSVPVSSRRALDSAHSDASRPIAVDHPTPPICRHDDRVCCQRCDSAENEDVDLSDGVGDTGQIFGDGPQSALDVPIPRRCTGAYELRVAAYFEKPARAEVLAATHLRVGGGPQRRRAVHGWSWSPLLRGLT
jgi:hypothetical protein